MVTDADRPLSVSHRRRAMRCAYWNGAVWAIGNGLASTTLVIYLAMELGAQQIGLGIGMILATRYVVGLLRLGAPAVIGRWVDRKRFCLGCFLLATLVLLSLPLVAAPGRLPSAEASLAALIVLWCAYHVLQYLGMVALWSWLADLVPLRIRGRFLGRRERWMVAGTAVGALTCGLFTWWWKDTFPRPQWWIGYAIPTALGGCYMIASLLPLARIPRLATSPTVRFGATLDSMLAPFSDRRFQRLLFFGCWFSFANGLTQSAQYSYPYQILAAEIVVFAMLAMQTGMRLGQFTVSPFLGRLADRAGNRPVMMGSLLLVAQGPLFYFFATPAQPWWLVGAWTVWIAYAGLNVCLPNLMLKLSPEGSNTPYIATYFAVTGLCYAVHTIVGGALSDRYGESTFSFFGGVACDYYQLLFLAGWIARSLGLIVLLVVIEGEGRNDEGGTSTKRFSTSLR
ncbi:MAG TPA: MFS transporter [Thermoguttaceae bacterium]|nr:MFS transporter [Thermoguttaceae bacterium]